MNGFVSGMGELGEELAVEEEVGAEHFGNGETPNGMADVFQELLLEKGCVRLRENFGGTSPKPPE
jgi:hypothetical protein